MAASYVSKHDVAYQGLILLAAYSTVDIHESGLRVLSIYGSKDGVMNRESFAEYQENLPSDAREYVIEGGCHSYFRFYGKQKNDQEAGITRKERIDLHCFSDIVDYWNWLIVSQQLIIVNISFESLTNKYLMNRKEKFVFNRPALSALSFVIYEK